jgi:hypothetical protein
MKLLEVNFTGWLIGWLVVMVACVAPGQTQLGLLESPGGSGYFSNLVNDTLTATGSGNAKTWLVELEGGDRLTVWVATDKVGSYPRLRLRNAGGTLQASHDGTQQGEAMIQNFTVSTPGSYSIQVYSDNLAGDFRMRVGLGRGFVLESEPNDSEWQASTLTVTANGGGFTAKAVGVLEAGFDYHDLGSLSAGNAVNVTLGLPSSSSLQAQDVEMVLFRKGSEASPLASVTGSTLNAAITETGEYQLRLRINPNLSGHALKFDGSDDEVSLGNPEALRQTGDQTLEMWIRPDGLTTRSNPWNKTYGGEGTITLETDGTLNYFYGTSGVDGGSYQTFAMGRMLPVGQWSHIAVVRRLSAEPRRLFWYVNGRLVNEAAANYFPAAASSLPALIGKGYAGRFNGLIDEVRVWNVARSGAQIAAGMGQSLNGNEPGLVAYYPFAEGQGSVVGDATANALDGTIAGEAEWRGSVGVGNFSSARAGMQAQYVAVITVTDAVGPQVNRVRPLPVLGHVYEGIPDLLVQPANMTAYRGQNGSSFTVQVTGSSGSIWGSGVYTDDSALPAAVRHAGLLANGETGLVTVTILPGQGSYIGSTQNGISSGSYGSHGGSYSLSAYTGPEPVFNGIFASLRIDFSERILAPTLQNPANVELRHAGADAVFGTADDSTYTLTTNYDEQSTRAYFTVVDEPLQPGLHRLRLTTGIQDRGGNPLEADSDHEFTITDKAPFVLENRSNNTRQTATLLNTASAAEFDRSFTYTHDIPSGGNPHRLKLLDLDGDGIREAIVALQNQNQVRVYRGLANGAFEAASTNYSTGSSPWDLELIDFDKDGRLDVVVSCNGGSQIRLHRNVGDGTLEAAGSVAVGASPMRLVKGHFNGDSHLDLAVVNNGTGATGRSVSILLADGTGGFVESKLTVEGNAFQPYGLAAGDVDGDGHTDLVVGDYETDQVRVFTGNGNGTFNPPVDLAMDGLNPSSIGLADFDHDGHLDILAAANAAEQVAVYKGNGDGSFQAFVTWPLGSSATHYFVEATDVDGDGWADLLVPRSNGLVVLYNQRSTSAPSFTAPLRYEIGSARGADLADVNGDGRPDLVVNEWNSNRLRTLLGNARAAMSPDPALARLAHAYGRGRLLDGNDEDWFVFSIDGPKRVVVAADNPLNASSSGLNHYLYNANGSQVASFTSSSSGQGQSGQVNLSSPGSYYLRVTQSNSYTGEYRFRVSAFDLPLTIESEINDSIGQADSIEFALGTGVLTGSVAGYLANYDTSGDYWALGNLGEGTIITLDLRVPQSSPLNGQLQLFKADGTQVAVSGEGELQLVHPISAGQASAYFLRVVALNDTRGLRSEYLVDVSLADPEAPFVTSVSLPAEGTSASYVAPNFSLGFSEDMLASTVMQAANYELRSAGPDGVFDTSDDELYTVVPQTYSAGLTASYHVPDGPLQPGNYRFRAGIGLTDKFANPLAEVFTRLFTVVGVPGYVLESRDNNSRIKATPLNDSPPAGPDGSFGLFGSTATGDGPWGVQLYDLDGDGHLDAIVALNNANQLAVLPGLGDGTFGAPVTYASGSSPWDVELIDVDGDALPDVVVSCQGNDQVRVYRNLGDGTLQAGAILPVGDGPRHLVRGNFNGDAIPDLAVVNQLTGTGGRSISLLLGDGEGSFTESKITVSGQSVQFYALTVGDFNGDGLDDLAAGDQVQDAMAIFLNTGGGSFAEPVFYPVDDADPTTAAAADFDGDGHLDLAVGTEYHNRVSLLKGVGDGSFLPFTTMNVDGNNYMYAALQTPDLNGDGWPDLLIPKYNGLVICYNRGDGTMDFLPPLRYSESDDTGSVAWADLNGDGCLDLVASSYNLDRLYVWTGNDRQYLAEDSVVAGLRHGALRGFLTTDSDEDWFRFSARAQDRLLLTTETADGSSSSGRTYQLFSSAGTSLGSYSAASNGYGQWTTTLTHSGTYYLRVSSYWGGSAEYRARLTLAPAPTYVEVENNNSLNEFNTPPLVLAAGSLSGTVLGVNMPGDSNGDYFNLGNLTPGTQVTVTAVAPQPAVERLDALTLDHRWSFGESEGATQFTDSVTGLASAELRGSGATVGGGLVLLPGGSSATAPYIDLPNGLISNRASGVTIEGWALVNGSQNWSRLFDFGSGTAGELLAPGGTASAQKYLYLSAQYNNNMTSRRLAIQDGRGEAVVDFTVPYQAGELFHFAVAYERRGEAGGTLRCYRNGVLVASSDTANRLTAIDDVNNWLGRSQWTQDNNLNGGFSEFRIWDGAYSDAQAVANAAAGPDALAEPVHPAQAALPYLTLFKATGQQVAMVAPGDGPLQFTLGEGDAASYRLRVHSNQRSTGALYQVAVAIEDVTPPFVTSNSLPAEGSTVIFPPPAFSLGFSEDMLASSVRDAGNYELRSAGPNGVFDDGDDVIYTLAPDNYTSGLNATIRIVDGPLQEGEYRFTAGTGLCDLFERPLGEVHVRHFRIEGVPGYVTESRDNNSIATADILSGNNTQGGFDGSYAVQPAFSSGGSAPISLLLPDLNGDGHQDLVVSHRDSANLAVRLGVGDGTFGEAVTYATGASPHYMALIDFDKDGRQDVVVTNLNSDNVSLFRNVGDGSLVLHATLAAGDEPLGVATGDFNGDGNPDFAVANYGQGANGRCLSVFLGDGLGSFSHSFVGNDLTPAWRPYHLTVADFDGNGLSDIATVNHSGNEVLVFLATGAGAFGDPSRIATNRSTPTGIVAADFNGDFQADLVVCYDSYDRVNLLAGNGDGSFQETQGWTLDGNRTQYNLRVGDLNGDGYPDLLAPRWGSLVVRQNTATPVLGFNSPVILTELNQVTDVAVADLDGDGRRDLIALSHDQGQVLVYKGQGSLPLAADSQVAGLRHGYGRGQLDVSDDLDYFLFSARGGEKLVIAAEILGAPSNSSLSYSIYDYRNSSLLSTTSSNNGYSYSQPYTLPYDGRFYLRVAQNYVHSTEYRFRVTVVDAQTQIESESNNNTGDATVVAFSAASGSRTAKVFGHLAGNDSLGDYWRLGNLAGGTQINVTLNRPQNSSFTNGVLSLLNASGSVVTTSEPGGLHVAHTVAGGAEGQYYLRLTEDAGNRNLHCIYQLSLSLTDALPPQITGTSLPDEGGSTLDFINSFTLSFNEDMQASTVTAAANYQLREAGVDQVLGTSDDVFYNITPAAYSTGLAATYNLGYPLQPGQYRLTVSGLRDTYGNSLPAAFVRHFTVAQMPGFTTVQPGSGSLETATSLVQVEDPAGLITGLGRGRRISSSDVHYWTFQGSEGQKLTFDAALVGASATINLQWRLRRPDGSLLWEGAQGNNDQGLFPTLTLDATGVYSLQVSESSTWQQEYRFRLSLTDPALVQQEAESNNTIGSATPLTFTSAGDVSILRVAGIVHSATDLDYFHLGTLPAGKTLFVSAALPATSPFLPVVAVYNASGQYISEVNGGPGDGSAELRINIPGDYYLLVRSTAGTGDYLSQYVAEVQVHETSAVAIPNLQVTDVVLPPESNLKSGDSFTYSFTVTNVGSVDIAAGSWSDRLVLSANLVFGDADDTEMGVFVHEGGLAMGDSYTVTGTASLPEGAVGNYHLIVRTDIANQVDEVILENDNTTATESTFPVTLAPYPNLVVQNLNVTGPVEDVFGLSWTLANTGNLGAPAGFKERVRVVNTTTGAVVLDELRTPGALDASGSLERTAEVSAPVAGVYQVTVTADAQDDVYEHDGVSHIAAEANSVQAGFTVLQYWTIAVSTPDPVRGSVSGGGTFLAGTPVTVTAVPNVSVLPYQFVRWTQNGVFVSASPTYTFSATANRELVAEFNLPTYQVSAQVTPAGAGSVVGTGFFNHGASTQLTATPSQGYLFGHWLENDVQIGSEAVINLSVTGPRILQAVFVEANPIHEVVTATEPPGLGVTTGHGTFTNGQSSAFSASASIEDGDTEYVFDHWKLNGVFFGNQGQFSKTFSTLDAPVMNFTAHYTTRSLKPAVTQVVSNYASPVRAAADVHFILTFDRPMNPAVLPVLELTSTNAPITAALPAGGEWLSATQFRSAAVAFGADNGGAYQLGASAAADAQGRVMAAAVVYSFDVDATPPPNPLPMLATTTVNSATIQWSGYAAPADLNAFRVYLQPADFNSTTGLTAVSGLGAAPRSYTFTGLQPDTPYYAAVTAVDTAGNSSPEVTSVPILLASSLPPPVALSLSAPTPQSALLDWSAYDTSALVGFQGWRVFVEETPFNDVSDLTPATQLAAGVKIHQLTGLDRSKTYYIAVVGYNRLGEFNPAATAQAWSDPLAGQITTDLTLGSADADLTLDILQSMVVKPGVTLTVLPGTILRFAAGTGLIIEGHLVAEGTPLRPIHFTSIAEAAAKGDWNGVRLVGAGNSTRLSHLWVSYGRGLQVEGGSPLLGPIFCVRNEGQGLEATGNAQLQVADSFFAFNDRGVRAADAALVSVTGSVVRTNSLHDAELVAGAGAVLDMPGNWWGSSQPADIAARVAGAVETSSPLTGEPVLATGIAVAGGLTSTGVRDLPLRLASANAVAFRLSENSLFPGVLWQDIFPAGETDTYSPRPVSASYQLSAGAGLKTVFVQFRSLTGQASQVLPIQINLITDGPSIQTFSLTDGQVISRPLTVTGTASAALGLEWLRFYAGEELLASTTAGSLNFAWDMRSLSAGPLRVRLLARDRAGNESSREVNVQLDPQPPPAPVITAPQHQAIVATAEVTVGGTAEPGVTVRLSRNGAPQGSTAAAPNGAFSFASVPLIEGVNNLVATAEDVVGTRASTAVSVTRDSGPPAAVVLEEPPVYDAFRGLVLRWGFAPSGERPIKYRVFWHTAPFIDTAQVSGQSGLLDVQTFTLTNAPDGDLYLAVVGYDAAGNASPLSNVIAYRLDRTAPTFLISYDKGMPAGPGPLTLVLEANEALAATPLLTIKPNGLNTPISVPLTKTSGTTYTATFNVTPVSARTGAAVVHVTGQDLTGNRFSGSPGGTALSFDVTPPTATLSFDRPVPIKTVSEADPSVPEDVNLSFNLTLSEAPKPGTTPSLSFTPPIGADIVPVLTGSGVNWTGSFVLTAAMGKGQGQFVFSATDARDNTGSSVNPNQLEIYNTEHPNAPGIPVNLRATTLAGGHVRIQWNAVSDAHSYRIYREPGNTGVTPVVMVADGITATEWTDETVPADGIYRYAVRAFRVSVEGNPSGTLNALSDRTPPNAPEQPAVELTQQGLRLSWNPPSEGELPHHYNVYRNGVKIRTVDSAQPVLDFPPKGLLQYEVAAADSHENESLAAPVTFEFFVDAVDNLVARVGQGQPTVLTWTFSDPNGVGYHIYRNGVRQTSQPIALATRTFTDLLPLPPNEAVDYRVTAIDGQGREGAPRTVRVLPVAWTLLMNPDADGVARVSRTRYFDNYRLNVHNNDATSPLQLGSVQVSRTLSGGAVTAFTQQTPLTIAPAGQQELNIPVPGAELAGQNQNLEISVRTTANEAGSQVVYAGSTSGLLAAVEPPLMVEMRVLEPPVAGGLAEVRTRLYNRGYTPIQVVLGRQTGQQPGDLYLQVLDESGAEISRRNYNGFGAPGLIVRPNGDAYVEIEAGASVEVTIDAVPVPIVLAETGRANFRATVGQIFSGLGTANERVSGPLTGTLQSSVVETPYYGSVSTEKDIFSGDEPIVIAGQAIDRASSNPQGSVKMRIGFAARGAVWYEEVDVDADGNFNFSYTPMQGFAGELTLWAAHPDVFDVLAQKTVRIYRLYSTPSFGNIRMSKNDHLDFNLTLINPGDLSLSGVGIGFRAYRLGDDAVTEIPIPEITCAFQDAAPAGLGPNRRTPVNLRLAATADAPDQANLEITFTTAEGASAKFTGTLELLPAVPVLSMTSPRQGYVDVTVNKGQIVSQQVTVQNLGTRALTGVELVPPLSIPWMQVNLPLNAAGNVDLPDLEVGATYTFTLAFVPPADTAQNYYNDVVKIRGSNVAASFDFNVFALVSSDAKGDATFHVENFLGQEVPNASVRIRNAITGQEVGPRSTDANGDVLFADLVEGQYSWNVTASGHSAATGTLQVVPAQTTIIEPVLQRSLVTVTFQVRPVPFTDRYEIVIEQTFETFVPAPVLVFTPPKYDFTNVRPGFETTVIYELKNHGLIKLFNVEVSGTYAGLLTLEPLIDFIPELLPQQTVQVPCRVRLGQYLTDGEAGGCDESIEDWIERRSKPPPQVHPDGYVFGGPAPTIGNLIGGFCPTPNLADFINGLSAIASLGADGCFMSQQSGSLGNAAAVALAAAVVYETVGGGVYKSLADVAMEVAAALGQCAAAHFASAGPGGGGGGGGGPGGGGGYGAGGNGCFTADTLVRLADGRELPIASLKPGDTLAIGPDPRETAQLRHLYTLESDELLTLSLRAMDEPAAPARELRVTGEHLVWRDGRGWTHARDLRAGDWLHGEDGAMIEITAVKPVPGMHRVYTLQLKGGSTFYAGGVLVQDLCGGLYLEPAVLSKLQPVQP